MKNNRWKQILAFRRNLGTVDNWRGTGKDDERFGKKGRGNNDKRMRVGDAGNEWAQMGKQENKTQQKCTTHTLTFRKHKKCNKTVTLTHTEKRSWDGTLKLINHNKKRFG